MTSSLARSMARLFRFRHQWITHSASTRNAELSRLDGKGGCSRLYLHTCGLVGFGLGLGLGCDCGCGCIAAVVDDDVVDVGVGGGGGRS